MVNKLITVTRKLRAFEITRTYNTFYNIKEIFENELKEIRYLINPHT